MGQDVRNHPALIPCDLRQDLTIDVDGEIGSGPHAAGQSLRPLVQFISLQEGDDLCTIRQI